MVANTRPHSPLYQLASVEDVAEAEVEVVDGEARVGTFGGDSWARLTRRLIEPQIEDCVVSLGACQLDALLVPLHPLP